MSCELDFWPLGGEHSGPFIGRKSLLAELRGALFSPADRRHISIYGMPRVGKTWLLREARRNVPDKILPIFGVATSLREILLGNCLHPTTWHGHGSALEEAAAPFVRDARKPENWYDTMALLALFRGLLRITTEMGYRVVLFVDEFDLMIEESGEEPGWSEAEYTGFVGLLMARELNVTCATASRRTVESLISHKKYRWRLNPFESRLLTGFDTEDMEECFQRLERAAGPISPGDLDKLMYRCGRNPHLLNRLMLSPYVRAVRDEGKKVTLEDIYAREETKAGFENHFSDVISFMLYEEELRIHNFSHIVKCYFDPSPDYWDVQKRSIEMGYLELLNPKSRFTWHGRRSKFIYRDIDLQYENATFADKLAPGEHQYVYITLSPYFIDRFYTAPLPPGPSGEDGGTVLEQIKDAKDLLASFIYTLRDITDDELRQASCADCKNKSVCPQCERGEMAGVFGAEWNEKLLRNCVKTKGKDTGGSVTFFKFDGGFSPNGHFKAKPMGDGDERCIFFSSPCGFLLSAFNRSAEERSPIPLLDPINLSSNGDLITNFLPRFRNYFGCFESFDSGPDGDFQEALRHLQGARNEIAHYSSVGMTTVMTEDTAALCRYLLRSIYLWRCEGEEDTPGAPPEWRTGKPVQRNHPVQSRFVNR